MSIVASIRRAVLIDEARGHVILDSDPILDNTPQVAMEPGDEDIFLNFTDGFGWGHGKNVYTGYSETYIWSHNAAPSASLTDALDDSEQGAVPVYDEDTGTYKPVQLSTGCTTFVIEKPENRAYPISLELPFDIEVIAGHFTIDAGPVDIDFNLGDHEKGDPLFITVSDTTAASEFLTIQVDWIRK